MSNLEAPPKVSKDLPKPIGVMLINAIHKHRKLSISLGDISRHIALLETKKEENTTPSFLNRLPKPECKLSSVATDIQNGCNEDITSAHKKFIEYCADIILEARLKEQEIVKNEIQQIETKLIKDGEEYLEKLKSTLVPMCSVSIEEANKKINTENTKVKNLYLKDYKVITAYNLRKVGIDRTNAAFEKEKRQQQKDSAREVVVVDNTNETVEKLIEKKIASALSTPRKLTSLLANVQQQKKSSHNTIAKTPSSSHQNEPKGDSVINNRFNKYKQNKFIQVSQPKNGYMPRRPPQQRQGPSHKGEMQGADGNTEDLPSQKNSSKKWHQKRNGDKAHLKQPRNGVFKH